MNTQRLLTLDELASETGIPRDTLYHLVAPKGDLACVRSKIGGTSKRQTRGMIRVRWCDWEDWVARHRVAPREEVKVPTPSRRSLNLPGADRYAAG